MDRLEIDQAFIESLAVREFNAASTEDLDLPAEERRDRVALDDTTTDLIPPNRLKRYDDVRLWNWVNGRVSGPGRGPGEIFVHSPSTEHGMGDIIRCSADAITDRAPLNPAEPAMPVIPAEPEPPVDLVDLEILRMQAFAKIDARSDALIAAGFNFGGIVYSCSLEAQIRMSSMLMVADQFTYPLEINALDDRSKGILNSPQDTQMWALTALQHIKSVVDSGTVEKDRIRNATDVPFLANYEDPRLLPPVNPYVPIAPGQPSNDNATVDSPSEELLTDEA